MSYNSWIEINESKILNNVDKIREISNDKKMIAIVKADAYGVGIEETVNVLKKRDIFAYGVANISEALELRRLIKNKKILILGPINIKDIDKAEKNNIDITVHSYEYLKKIRSKVKKNINIHLKICLSMNRIGIKSKEELKKCIIDIKKSKALIQEGLFSHFSTGVKRKCKVYKKDIKELKKILKEIDLNEFNLVHFSNTSTLLTKKNIPFENSYRVGIGLYGYIDNDINLKETIKIKSRIIQIRKIKKGSYIGYNSNYKVKKNSIIATIPIGYADGILRNNKDKIIKIRNKYYSIVGDICMDYIMVKIDRSIRVFDTIEIECVKLAKSQRTIIYEVLTNLSKRLKRKII